MYCLCICEKMLQCTSLTPSIIARGKALHSAVSSLQNFDRSLEKFVAWLSEAESLLDAAERDPHLLKVSLQMYSHVTDVILYS